MGIRAIDKVFEYSRQKGSKLLLLVAIADNAKDDGSGAWPGRDTLARKARVGLEYVDVLIQELVTAGELRVHVRGAPNGKTDMYDILYPAVPYSDELYVAERQARVTRKRAAGKTTAGKPRAKKRNSHKKFLRLQEAVKDGQWATSDKKFLPFDKNFLRNGKNFLCQTWPEIAPGAAGVGAEPSVEPLLEPSEREYVPELECQATDVRALELQAAPQETAAPDGAPADAGSAATALTVSGDELEPPVGVNGRPPGGGEVPPAPAGPTSEVQLRRAFGAPFLRALLEEFADRPRWLELDSDWVARQVQAKRAEYAGKTWRTPLIAALDAAVAPKASPKPESQVTQKRVAAGDQVKEILSRARNAGAPVGSQGGAS